MMYCMYVFVYDDVCMYVFVYDVCMYVRTYVGTYSTCLKLLGPPYVNSADVRILCREVFLFGRFKMYYRNCTGTVSHVLCREVYSSMSLFGRVHYRRFHCIYV